MNQIIQSIKKTIAKKDFDAESLVAQLKELREFIKTNLDEPGFVRMVRLAYENIEENGTYTFEYTEGEDPKANLGYLIDLLADYNNKYNREELLEYRKMMEGEEWVSPEDEWKGEDEDE
ncbi:MAG: hypothetical protein EBZ58_08985 [Bacteroidetes bacterium]|jgi:hypothetical protein|nr:hypothetical protein [Bacteroidota bacterium]